MSKSKAETYFWSIVFVMLFLLPQIISFVSLPFNLVTPIWLLYILLVFVLLLSLPFRRKRYRSALIFMIIMAFGAMLSSLNGTSFGECVQKALFTIIGFTGYVLLSEKKIDLNIFFIVLLVLYAYFYKVYYSFGLLVQRQIDGDLFGFSSSNSIAMSLNIVLFTQYLLREDYGRTKSILCVFFSLVNLLLIIIQGSRAGFLVAAILFILMTYDIICASKKNIILGVLIVSLIIIWALTNYLDLMNDYIRLDSINGVSSYEEDVRGRVQRAFFEDLTLESFLFGYHPFYEFEPGITRSFNSFLDFWARFGIVPFALMLYHLVKRIINFKIGSIPIYCFIPLLAYSMFEAIWGGTLWDYLIFVTLFYNVGVYDNPKISEQTKASVSRTQDTEYREVSFR